MADEWPLVGRAGELREFQELLSARDSHGLVVAGGAGVGKTRLALECLHEAERADLVTARVTATRSAAGLPFGALAPLLPAAHHGEVGTVDDRSDLLRRSAAALVQRGGGGRLVLLVDDAHHLDDTSATLVHQLAATGAAFVLATVRTGEPAPDPVVALWKDGLAGRLDLAGLQVQAIDELLSAVLAGPVDRATVAQLSVRCQGNVLFLRELVLGALHDGSLHDEGGIWRLVGPLRPSDRLVELVEARLYDLEAAERALLEVLSFGEPIGPAELTAVADPIQAETLERKGLLISRRDGRRLEVRLAHTLYGEVLRARVPALRIPAIARSLAEVVEGTGARRREDILRVATWRLEGGEARPDLMLTAATTARWCYDFPLAERLARAAVDVDAGFDAALLAAQVSCLQGRSLEAEGELAALAAQAASDSQRGVVAVTRLDNATYSGQIEEAIRLADEAETAISDPGWRDMIAAKRSTILLGCEGPRVAAAAAEPLLQRAGGRALVWACLTASYSLGRLGRLTAALAASAQGHATHLALNEPLEWYPWFHLYLRCDALVHAGRFLEAEELATAQYEQGLADRSPEAQAQFALQLARTVAERGHVETATRQAREAVALFRHLGQRTFERFGLETLALALALGGRAAEATKVLAALDALDLPAIRYFATDLLQARAWLAVAVGDRAHARCLLGEAIDLGDSTGDLVGEAAALHCLARLGHAKAVASRMAVLAAEIEGDLVQARAGHAHALAKNDPPGLEAVSIAFEAMGASLLAAEAASDAAVSWRRAGDARQATRAEHRAVLLISNCQGAVTPALEAIGARARLTSAERETSLYAAAGSSNKEIAEKLHISVRTVESHLQRVYAKLGVSGRTELSAALESAHLVRPDGEERA